MNPVLEVQDLVQDFGGLRALNELTLNVCEKEIVALIGPNGAGKTTFFNCITGIYTPTSGTMHLTVKGEKHLLNGRKTHEITALGMARTFQNIRLFSQMTVLENVMIGRHCRTKAGILNALVRDPATNREEQETIDKSYELLKLVGLEQHWNDVACNLPYGAQRRLEIARAMATEPCMLLLDEPAAGMNPHETEELKELIIYLRDHGNLAVLLIEHDMNMVMTLSDRIYVMEYGSPLASGTPSEIRNNPDVIRAYLGESHNA
jgi:branched-chain amino acid transport system ATP-binding protein